MTKRAVPLGLQEIADRLHALGPTALGVFLLELMRHHPAVESDVIKLPGKPDFVSDLGGGG